MSEKMPIRGHICDGVLAHHKAATYDCIPHIDIWGNIVGCDDTNRFAVTHCPWCGVALGPQPPLPEGCREDD
jgi:hypothetical protein